MEKGFTLKKVHTRKDWEIFHAVPQQVYRKNPYWIAPLTTDIENGYQKLVKEGAAVQAFVLIDGKTGIGRISGYVKRNQEDILEGGICFFECIQNSQAADMLFDAIEAFFIKEGVHQVDGPVNFGERDQYWGLLTEGFNHSPVFQENYHPPYYRAFFENHDYLPFEKILTLSAQMKDVHMDRFRALARRIKNRSTITFKKLTRDKLEQWAADITEIYNQTFFNSPYFRIMESATVLKIMKAVQPFIDPDLGCIAYDGDRPVGFCTLMPDLNPYLKGLNGKVGGWRGLLFLLRFKLAAKKNIKGIAFGIVPDYQSKGVYPLLIDFLGTPKIFNKYQKVYLATIRANNEVMVNTTMNLGVQVERVHYTFRKVF
ncbi:MAG: hypothetical protein RLZZ248_1411 [Bacteroidota bacterium]|jgi:hypothetical protein